MIDKFFRGISWLSFLFFLFVFIFVIGALVQKGANNFELEFLFEGFKNAGREGGIFPIILSTLIVSVLALIISLVLSVITAVSIDSLKKITWLNKSLILALDTLSATPSIVFGLVGNIIFCEFLGLGYSLLSGALTLAMMILPIQTRIILIGLRNISESVQLSLYALNIRNFSSYFRVKLQMITQQLFTGSLIGYARALAETAALLFTSGYGVKSPSSLLDSGRTLSVHIFELAMNVPGGNENAFKSALTLVCIILIISLFAHHLQNRLKVGKVSLVWN